MTRPLLGVVVLLAIANLGSGRVEPPTEPLTEALPTEERSAVAHPAEWSVAVDGWRIEIDGVVVVAPEVVPPPIGVVRGGGGGLRLERLALYADSIGRHAAAEGVDWRLVAAVIAEESAFQANAMSSAGAFGLMQVKEVAAREVGVYPYSDPDSNIRAGVRYLAAMRRAFPAATPRDRDAMMLAAYNMGPGHMRDARALARALGLPAYDWDDSVASAVRLLEEPSVHQRLRHGFAQGDGVVRYVERVLKKYGEYSRRFPEVTAPSVAVIADLASR